MADESAGAGKCPVSEKVSTLLGSWRSAAEEAKKLPADEIARIKTELANAAKECPVGSRMGETIGFVKAVLAHSRSVEESCGKHCPLASAQPCPATEAKAARSRLIKDLDELAGYAACALGAECAGKETAAGPHDPTPAKSGPAACAEGLAARAAALKASWEKAPAELAALSPEKRQQIQTVVKGICERSKAAALIPETVQALAKGFEAIDVLNGKLDEWAKAHPEAIKSIPADTRKVVEGNFALLASAREILQGAVKTCGSACKEARTETAAR
jgi:hypothetical protein